MSSHCCDLGVCRSLSERSRRDNGCDRGSGDWHWCSWLHGQSGSPRQGSAHACLWMRMPYAFIASLAARGSVGSTTVRIRSACG